MSLSDYKLPAKSVNDDAYSTPIAAEFICSDLQIRGVFKMLNEKRVAAGLARLVLIRIGCAETPDDTSNPNPPLYTGLSAPSGFVFYQLHNDQPTFSLARPNNEPGNSSYYWICPEKTSVTINVHNSNPDVTDVDLYGDVTGSFTGSTGSWSKTISVADWASAGDPEFVDLLVYFGYGSTTTLPATILSGALIEFLRLKVEEVIPYYVDTDVHPDGDITGETSVTNFTRKTCFAAAGVGVEIDASYGNTWTNIPSRNIWGYSEQAAFDSGDGTYRGMTVSTLDMFSINVTYIKTVRYKEHLNEMITIMGLLLYRVVSVSIKSGSLSGKFTGTAELSGYDQTECNSNYGYATAAHSGLSYGTHRVYSNSDGTFVDSTETSSDILVASTSFTVAGEDPALINHKGILQADLSTWSSGTLTAYLLLVDAGLSASTTFGNNPPVATKDSFQEWSSSGFSLGSVSDSNTIGDTDADSLSLGTACPVTPFSSGTGWKYSSAKIIVAPAFTL